MIPFYVVTSGFHMISNGWWMVTYSEGLEMFGFPVMESSSCFELNSTLAKVLPRVYCRKKHRWLTAGRLLWWSWTLIRWRGRQHDKIVMRKKVTESMWEFASRFLHYKTKTLFRTAWHFWTNLRNKSFFLKIILFTASIYVPERKSERRNECEAHGGGVGVPFCGIKFHGKRFHVCPFFGNMYIWNTC